MEISDEELSRVQEQQQPEEIKNEEELSNSTTSMSVSITEEGDESSTTKPEEESSSSSPNNSNSNNNNNTSSAPSSPSLKSDQQQQQQQQPVQSSINYSHNAKLIQVTGPEEPYHYISIPLSVDRLNLQDAFIMQSDAYMFVWCSDKVSSQKKAKAIQMAQKLKVEIGCARAVQVLEFGEEHPTFLYCLGLPKGNKLNVEKEENDIFQKDEEDELLLPEFFLYKLSTGEDGKPSIKPIEEEVIKQEMLESNACFILDCEHEMYIWQGKDVKKSTKETLIPLAKKIWSQYDRPEYYNSKTLPIITMVFDGAESCLFKSKFSKWVDKAPVLTSYLSLQKKKESITFEVSSMHEDKPINEINIGSNDSKGKLLVWSCTGSNGKWLKVEEDDFGIFYSNKSYVCHFIYKPEGKSSIRSVIFYWEGLYANARNYISYKFGLYKEIQKKMQSLQSDDPVEYRIAQNKEPKEFINLFGTELLVLNEELSMKPMIFQVRGIRGTQLYANPEGCNAKLLNSLDSFVFLFPEKYIIVWHGKASTEQERTLAADLFTFLPPEYESGVKEFEEGSESDGFWKLIGGSSSDITKNDVDGEKPAKLKLFLCTENSGIFKADQVNPFSQVDLNNEEALILDVYTMVFVWKGSKCSDSKYKQTLSLAKDYIETANDNRPSSCTIQEEESQSESQLFKSYFNSWKVIVPKVFVDPLLIYKQKQKEQQEKEQQEKEQKEKEQKEIEQQVSEPIIDAATTITQEQVKQVDESVVDVEEIKSEEETATVIEENKSIEEPAVVEEIKSVEEPIEQVKEEEEAKEVKQEEEKVEDDEQVVPNVEDNSNKEQVIDEANTSANTTTDSIDNNISTNTTTTTTTTTTTISITESPDLQPLSSSQDVIPTPIKEKRKSNEPVAPSSINSSGDLIFDYGFPTATASSPKMNRKNNKKRHNKKNHSVGSMSPATSPTNYPKSLKNDIVNQSFELDSNNSSGSNNTSEGNSPLPQLNQDSTSSSSISPLSQSTSAIQQPSSSSQSGSSTPKKNNHHHHHHHHGKKNKNKKQHNRSNSNL